MTMPANPTPAEVVVVIDANGRLDLTDRATLGTFIGKSLATFVSGNRMPEISGDDRKRIPEHIRRRYDAAAEQAAGYILAMLAARPAAPTQSAGQMGEVDSAKACGDRMVRVADALMPWLKNYPPSTRRERAIEAANAAISAALSQPEPSQ